MKKLGKLFVGFVLTCLVVPAYAQDSKFDFKNEQYGAQSKFFCVVTGNWHIDKDDHTLVYAADGRNKGPEFPLSIFKGVDDFKSGTIEVFFKAISGTEDRAAGIAFNIKPNGDYLVIRANALEDNLILFRVLQGRRSSLQEADHAPTPSAKRHDLKVVIKGNRVEGYLNNKKYIDYAHKENINGRIGLWSKADSYVYFDTFIVQPR